jgi:hypothetical protein
MTHARAQKLALYVLRFIAPSRTGIRLSLLTVFFFFFFYREYKAAAERVNGEEKLK